MRNHLTWFVLLLLLLPATALAAEGGWYLLLPPVEPGQNVFDAPKVNTSAPMSQWRQEDAFDSAEECRTHRQIQRDRYNTEADIAWKQTPYLKNGDKDYRHYYGRLYLGHIAEVARYANALCIASNDPRLAPSR